MAYQMLTGQKPRGRAKAVSVLNKSISRRWDAWVDKCMEVNPAERFQSADEALEGLGKVFSGKKWLVPVLAAAAMAVVATGAVLWHSHAPLPKPNAPVVAAPVTAPVAEPSVHEPDSHPLIAEATKASPTLGVPKESPVSEPETLAEPERSGPAAAEAPKREVPAVEAVKTEPPKPLAPGGLTIRTDPPGARVQVAGLATVTSPTNLEDLAPKDYALTISLDGYEAVTGTVTVEPGKFAMPPVYRLARSVGSLSISSTPQGSRWRVTGYPEADGMPSTSSGVTPATLNKLPTGAYEVEFTRPGWAAAREKVTVSRGQAASLSHEFASGALTINCNLAGTSWEAVSGPGGADAPKLSGTAPDAIGNVPVGDYEIEYRRPGWGAARERVTIMAGRAATVSHEFLGGALELSANLSGASWAVVSGPGEVRREWRGTAPGNVGEMPAGEYTIEFTRSGWSPVRVRASVPAGKSAKAAAAFPVSRIEVTSTPSGAEVIDSAGVSRGVTPLTFEETAPVTYSFTLRKDGRQDAAVSGTSYDGQTLRLSAALPEKPKGAAIGSNWTVPDYGIEMIWIAPGSFQMGSPTSESGRSGDEAQHRVTLAKGYWLGKYEVTQGQWQAVMGSNPSSFKNAGSNAPVENVSWEDAQAFCKKLTDRERAAGRLPAGYEYSLPTEAQWEYACRAGTTGTFSYGNDLDSSMANFDGNYPYGNGRKGQYRQTTVAVGSFRPNAWGLYDMHGNVWEWCNDWYGDYPSGAVTDPTGPVGASSRVFRGGCWDYSATSCRSANRGNGDPGGRYNILGFRLALRSVQ
jgi:formylglycine-generating enzyme required for sulfatase activity